MLEHWVLYYSEAKGPVSSLQRNFPKTLLRTENPTEKRENEVLGGGYCSRTRRILEHNCCEKANAPCKPVGVGGPSSTLDRGLVTSLTSPIFDFMRRHNYTLVQDAKISWFEKILHNFTRFSHDFPFHTTVTKASLFKVTRLPKCFSHNGN